MNRSSTKCILCKFVHSLFLYSQSAPSPGDFIAVTVHKNDANTLDTDLDVKGIASGEVGVIILNNWKIMFSIIEEKENILTVRVRNLKDIIIEGMTVSIYDYKSKTFMHEKRFAYSTPIAKIKTEGFISWRESIMATSVKNEEFNKDGEVKINWKIEKGTSSAKKQK